MKAGNWIIVAILAILAILFGIMWMSASNKVSGAQKKAEDAQKLYENASATLSDIQSSLDAMGSDLLGEIIGGDEVPGSTPEDRRARLISNISNMRTQIEADKKKIAELERQLTQVKGQRDGHLKALNKLKTSLADKEAILAEMENRLNKMGEDIEEVQRQAQAEINRREGQIQEKQGIIDNQSRDLNRIYYISGTRKELMAAGIVDRKGGLLGIGRVTTVTSKINTEKFHTTNLMDTQEIRFPASAKGYAVLSNHVAASYTLTKDASGWVLTVKDPENFRKQKFLVLEKL
ncbi:MAG TPA: hypothetical protein PL126_05310 [Candidatus Cloacimonadota bacterium]|mgnify:CR=1 FL=1|nr:hypothetical protein [Candidatus Cloacimonadota bacterium]